MKTDTTYLQQAVAHPDHRYWSEINRGVPQQISDTISQDAPHSDPDSVFDWMSRFLTENRGLSYFLCFLLVCLIAYVVYKIVKDFNMDTSKESKPQGMGSDTIYGHDWEAETKTLMERGAYGEVVVLCYLRWLDKLNDDKVIEFQTSKTPGMFLKEVETFCLNRPTLSDTTQGGTPVDDLTTKTATLTTNYLRIRYGHKAASQQLAKDMLAL